MLFFCTRNEQKTEVEKTKGFKHILLHLPCGMFALPWKMLGVIGRSVDLGQGLDLAPSIKYFKQPTLREQEARLFVKELRRLGVAVAGKVV